MPTARTLVIELAVLLVVAAVVAALGPYGTFMLGSFAERFAYWAPAILFGYAVVRPIMIVAPAAARRLDLPEWSGWAAAVLAAAFPITFVVNWLNGGGLALPSFERGFAVYLQVVLIGAGVSLVFWMIGHRAAVPAPTTAAPGPIVSPPAPADVPEPAFLRRLPPHLGRDLLALEMEDHYVRAHTAAGSALVLLRLRDAVAELAGADGHQVHRSWWVARGAVERVVQDGRNVRLRLRGGLEAPVARNSVPALRAAGWF